MWTHASLRCVMKRSIWPVSASNFHWSAIQQAKPKFKSKSFGRPIKFDSVRQPQRMRLAKLKPSTRSSGLGLPKSFPPGDHKKRTTFSRPGSVSGSKSNRRVPPEGKNVFDEDYRHGIQVRDPNNVSRRDVARMALDFRKNRPQSGISTTRRNNQAAHRSLIRRVTSQTSSNPSQSPVSKAPQRQGDIQMKLRTEFATDQPHVPAITTTFSSPPLLDGLLTSLEKVLGSRPKPTSIQALSIDHFLGSDPIGGVQRAQLPGSETLLASETGSGKSYAYLLPLMQALKVSEAKYSTDPELLDINPTLQSPEIDDIGDGSLTNQSPPLKPGPRAIILSPTHELARQLSSYAKSLSHTSKLRIQCLSNPNRTRIPGAVAFSETGGSASSATARQGRQVDIMIGTPSRVLAMEGGVELSDHTVIGSTARTWGEYEKGEFVGTIDARMSLDRVEWVVIDEADVLFDRDFIETTRAILHDIKAAREAGLETSARSDGASLPFHLVVCSATIPVSLSNYLDANHPGMTRLVSHNIHRLPKKLNTEHVQWTGGHRLADIHKKIQDVWADDATTRARVKAGIQSPDDAESARTLNQKSKILIFCNEKSKVQQLANYLKTEKGVDSLVMVGDDEQRRKGSNKHLAGFLNPSTSKSLLSTTDGSSQLTDQGPSVLITTSLLSRGLDFSPSIKHVFVVDEPRSAVDFLHRAGRTGRAGKSGTVVLFEKGSRGSLRALRRGASRR